MFENHIHEQNNSPLYQNVREKPKRDPVLAVISVLMLIGLIGILGLYLYTGDKHWRRLIIPLSFFTATAVLLRQRHLKRVQTKV